MPHKYNQQQQQRQLCVRIPSSPARNGNISKQTTKTQCEYQHHTLTYSHKLPIATKPSYRHGYTCDLCQEDFFKGPLFHSAETGTDCCLACAAANACDDGAQGEGREKETKQSRNDRKKANRIIEKKKKTKPEKRDRYLEGGGPNGDSSSNSGGVDILTVLADRTNMKSTALTRRAGKGLLPKMGTPTTESEQETEGKKTDQPQHPQRNFITNNVSSATTTAELPPKETEETSRKGAPSPSSPSSALAQKQQKQRARHEVEPLPTRDNDALISPIALPNCAAEHLKKGSSGFSSCWEKVEDITAQLNTLTLLSSAPASLSTHSSSASSSSPTAQLEQQNQQQEEEKMSPISAVLQLMAKSSMTCKKKGVTRTVTRTNQRTNDGNDDASIERTAVVDVYRCRSIQTLTLVPRAAAATTTTARGSSSGSNHRALLSFNAAVLSALSSVERLELGSVDTYDPTCSVFIAVVTTINHNGKSKGKGKSASTLFLCGVCVAKQLDYAHKLVPIAAASSPVPPLAKTPLGLTTTNGEEEGEEDANSSSGLFGSCESSLSEAAVLRLSANVMNAFAAKSNEQQVEHKTSPDVEQQQHQDRNSPTMPPDTRALESWASLNYSLSDDAFAGAICGIQLIWAHHSCRRSGMATALVDCVRRHLIYGFQPSKGAVAFSQPTFSGKLFAQAYCGTRDFLVFE